MTYQPSEQNRRAHERRTGMNRTCSLQWCFHFKEKYYLGLVITHMEQYHWLYILEKIITFNMRQVRNCLEVGGQYRWNGNSLSILQNFTTPCSYSCRVSKSQRAHSTRALVNHPHPSLVAAQRR